MSMKPTNVKYLLLLIGGISAAIANAQNFQWAFKVGEPNDDVGHSITTDSSGNTYATGSFEGTADFDPSGNIANLTSNGDIDIFIAKYDGNANYLWAFSIGGIWGDEGLDITTDPSGSGDVYVTGYFNDTTDFDPSGNTANLISFNGSVDIFIAKYDANGNYLWAFNIGGAWNEDFGYGITIDTSGSGDIYVTGRFTGTADFDPSGNTANLTSNGNTDIFVAKYDANGNYLWAFNVGGATFDYGYAVTTDPAGSGDVYITGSFYSTVDFDPGVGTANLTSAGGMDIFFAKYDSNGNYLWAFNIGGTSNDEGFGASADTVGGGDVYITGYFNGTVDFDPSGNTANLTNGGMYVAKYDANGNYLWAFNVEVAMGWDIATCPAGSGDVYVTGNFSGVTDFDPSGNTANLTSNGFMDIFVAKYDSASNYQWAFSVGGTTNDRGYGITTDPTGSGDVFVTGSFRNIADFDPSGNTANLSSSGFEDIFVAKYSCKHNISDAPLGICIGDSALVYGNYATVAGTYYDSLLTINGCDSVHSTILTVNPVYNIIDSPVTICNGDVAVIYGNNETTAGTYYNNLTTVNGCDSIHSTVLTVDSVYASNDTISIVQGDSAYIGGGWQTTAGIYYDTLIAGNGCDSVVATTLIVTVGVDEHGISESVTIYPNPTTGKFQIQSPKSQIKRVEVYDLFGRKVLESKEQEVDMSGFAKGMYVYVVKGEGETVIGRGKVVIE